MRETTVNGLTLVVTLGDMTQEKVDAIVNAANSRLDHACTSNHFVVLKIVLGLCCEKRLIYLFTSWIGWSDY